MKYLFLFCITLLTISCDAQKSSKDVVKDFLSAIDNFDLIKANKLLIPNDDNLKALQNIKKFSDGMTPSQKAKYINNKKRYNYREDKTSTAATTIIATNTQGEMTVATVFHLKKVGNQWLIDSFISD
ncbi:hypothetical protein [Chitinophaga sancti]|uniref:hypothetical protein n=1 Tax=Chitinophaga sancti TaxID=1004 RepID=UPI003F7968E1